MFAAPNSIAFSICGMSIYYYGIILAIAIIIGTLVSDKFATKYFGLKKETVIDLAPYLIIFGIIGARLYYCILNHSFYMRFPTEILAIRHGGISIHGALLGGFIGLLLFSYIRKISWLKLCDITAIGLVLAQAIGRWGNFFNSEAYGLPTNLPWKLYIASEYRQIPFLNTEFYHPTFLYESILDFIIFLILVFLVKKNWNKKDGNLALIYLILYSFVRIFTEHYRIDSAAYIHGIPVAIAVSLCIITVSVPMVILKNLPEKEGK